MRNLKRTLAKLLATVMIVSSVMGSNVNAVTAYAQTSDETGEAVTVVTEETGADQVEETAAATEPSAAPEAGAQNGPEIQGRGGVAHATNRGGNS